MFTLNRNQLIFIKTIAIYICDESIYVMGAPYRNQSIDLPCKPIDWFLYEDNTGI